MFKKKKKIMLKIGSIMWVWRWENDKREDMFSLNRSSLLKPGPETQSRILNYGVKNYDWWPKEIWGPKFPSSLNITLSDLFVTCDIVIYNKKYMFDLHPCLWHRALKTVGISWDESDKCLLFCKWGNFGKHLRMGSVAGGANHVISRLGLLFF